MHKTKMKPILFNSEMVWAIRNGRKTVTRRIIKPQPLAKLCYTFAGCDCRKWSYPSKNAYKHWGDEYKYICEIPEQEESRHWTPPCHGDDILYVRETWAEVLTVFGVPYFIYKADPKNYSVCENFRRWYPSIHMPKEAARIFLKVKTVSVERLQDIDDDGVVAEGLEIGAPFDELWNSTISKSDLDRYGWDANPWVWVIEFGRISREEAMKNGTS